jgi:hypothetical protein
MNIDHVWPIQPSLSLSWQDIVPNGLLDEQLFQTTDYPKRRKSSETAYAPAAVPTALIAVHGAVSAPADYSKPNEQSVRLTRLVNHVDANMTGSTMLPALGHTATTAVSGTPVVVDLPNVAPTKVCMSACANAEAEVSDASFPLFPSRSSSPPSRSSSPIRWGLGAEAPRMRTRSTTGALTLRDKGRVVKKTKKR